jgi:CubicO group peptidase (beta-lactamase class C family)
MKFIRLAWPSFCLLFSLSVVFAQGDAVDSYVRAEMAKRHVPGLSLVVIQNKKIVRASSYGFANVELSVPVNENTSFEIASMTKQFTDVAILLLAEEGKLSLDDHITRYFGNLPLEWRDITIRQLMLHTAGLRDDWDEDDKFFLSNNTDEEFLHALTLLPLNFKPGEGFSYGCGPFVLGLIIQKVSGRSYAQFMQERIFLPLGMTSTHVNDAAMLVRDRAAGYMFVDGQLKNGARISPAAEARADVGIRTTALDLAKWDAAIYDNRLLTRSSWTMMFTPGKLNDGTTIPVGFGWFMFPLQGNVWKHGGAFRTGFNSQIDRYVDDRLTIIVLTNLRSGSLAGTIALTVAGFYSLNHRSRAALLPEADNEPARTQRLKSLLLALAAGNTDTQKTAEGFPFKLYRQKDWDELGVTQMKSFTFVGCKDLSVRPAGFFSVMPKQVCIYKISGANESYLSFALTSDGKVAYIEPYE